MEKILEIYNDAVLNSTAVYTYTAQTIEERNLWFQKKKEDEYPVLVFEENGNVLGFATFGPLGLGQLINIRSSIQCM
jgi:Sortase and related acyltransferases